VAELGVEIAGVGTAIVTRDPEVLGVVRGLYKGFLSTGSSGWRIEMKVEAAPSPSFAGDLVVRRDGDRAHFAVRRGDFAGTLDLSRPPVPGRPRAARRASRPSWLS